MVNKALFLVGVHLRGGLVDQSHKSRESMGLVSPSGVPNISPAKVCFLRWYVSSMESLGSYMKTINKTTIHVGKYTI